MDLLQIDPLRSAASDAGWRNLSPGIRAVWSTSIEGEDDAPRYRIIHSRLMQLHGPARLHRLGLQRAPGYVKCGSNPHTDAVTAFRCLVWKGDHWDVLRHERTVPPTADGNIEWFDLGGITTSGAIIEARRSEVDGWWTSWNLVHGAFILEGEIESQSYSRKESRLTVESVDLRGLPSGVSARSLAGEVRYETPGFAVGFSLGRAGFSFLALDDEGNGHVNRNLLRISPFLWLQGITFREIGAPAIVAPFLRHDVTGTVNVRGNKIAYHVVFGDAGQEYHLEWEVQQNSLSFLLTRKSNRAVRVWESSAWSIVCSSEVTPTTVLGHTIRSGESGQVGFPFLFHAPGHGSFDVRVRGGQGVCRSDSFRPLTFTSLEFKVGEVPQPEGDYLLPAGEYRLEGEMVSHHPVLYLAPGTPEQVSRALKRCAITSMTYRADTATLSNNGNSMHAPLCMDNWSFLATRIGDLRPGLPAITFLWDSVERWLDGGPGYASGGMAKGGRIYPAEDEYIMTGTAALLGLAEYLCYSGTVQWLNAYAPQISHQLELMRDRDVDDDGIVECTHRSGISGEHQWSTNWYDVISFGWKDAFSNAFLYRALVLLAEVLPSLEHPWLASGLSEWAQQLKENFLRTFFNNDTGWLAGWRCKDGKLHDYAFLAVNGAAVCTGVVDGTQAREIVEHLWQETLRVRMPDPRLGLPNNLWPVADADMPVLMHGRPMGHYLNGALSHSQSHRFVGALYRVGFTAEADTLLHALCSSLADGTAFGGCNSGIDWRYWDGGSCGYEGILTDQFGILGVALDRYRGQTTT